MKPRVRIIGIKVICRYLAVLFIIEVMQLRLLIICFRQLLYRVDFLHPVRVRRFFSVFIYGGEHAAAVIQCSGDCTVCFTANLTPCRVINERRNGRLVLSGQQIARNVIGVVRNGERSAVIRFGCAGNFRYIAVRIILICGYCVIALIFSFCQ